MKNFTSSILTLLVVALLGSNLNAQAFFTEDFANQLPADWTAVQVAGNNNATSNWVWTGTGPAGGFSTGPLTSTSGSRS